MNPAIMSAVWLSAITAIRRRNCAKGRHETMMEYATPGDATGPQRERCVHCGWAGPWVECTPVTREE